MRLIRIKPKLDREIYKGKAKVNFLVDKLNVLSIFAMLETLDILVVRKSLYASISRTSIFTRKSELPVTWWHSITCGNCMI